jgi:hypothetical protein
MMQPPPWARSSGMVDGVDVVEFFFGHLGHRLVAVGDAGVVHQHIETPVGVDGGPHHRRDLAAVGDVGGDADRRAAGPVDLRRHRFGRGPVDVGQDHAAALGSEKARDAGAEAGPRAGDHGDLSLQAHLVTSPLIPVATPRDCGHPAGKPNTPRR